jgi:AcrR family transcriptional regulator
MAHRARLTPDRILDAAMRLADARGLSALTMRSLAGALAAKPMAVYHYFTGKEEILDALVDEVFSQIHDPEPGGDWRTEMTRRCHSAREVLARHPWAVGLMESRTAPGPASLRHHDAVIGTLRESGFSVALTGHAYALIDSYVYGFAVQEAALPFDRSDVAEVAADIIDALPMRDYPYFAELTKAHVMQPGYDFAEEFDFGLELVLDGLEAALHRETGGRQ